MATLFFGVFFFDRQMFDNWSEQSEEKEKDQVQNKEARVLSWSRAVNSSLLHLLLGSFSSANCTFSMANAKHKNIVPTESLTTRIHLIQKN